MVEASVVDLLVNASSRVRHDQDGKPYTDFDPELLRYQLMDVASENFPAFLRAYKDAITWAEYAQRTTLPVIGKAIAALHTEFAENMMVSITGCSARSGDLLRVLTTQRSVQDLTLHSDSESKSIAERIRGSAGGPQATEQGAPAPAGGGQPAR